MVAYKAVSPPVEIATSPARVREVFLDFERLSEWHTGPFKSITTPPHRRGIDLQPGDKVRVVMSGMTMNPCIVENSAEKFVWDGGVKGVLIGKHFFEFQPSQITPGHTTFYNWEEFSGLVTSLFNFSSKERTAGAGFDMLNNDLKRKCEG